MKSAAVYRRVSTDIQEREGTSLQTQLEACEKYCQERGYELTHDFSEAFSGLALERPRLDELRELVRSEMIDAVICFSLDRLTRNPGHGVIITEELEKHRVKLETVTEEVDSSDLGKLISYIRGFASKLEAEKIRERSIRGRRARAREGRLPGGNGANIYGYTHIPITQPGGGRRAINESESVWVGCMFNWLVAEGLSVNSITNRLQAMNAPTKSGKPWNRSSVLAILTNPVFTGRTIFFTCKKGGKQFTRPESDWIEIEGATPAIISRKIFDDAQKQLQINRTRTMPQTRRGYLLRGHLRCAKCGKAYVGRFNRLRYYHCLDNLKRQSGKERCRNKTWNADKLEAAIWSELERYLDDRDLIAKVLQSRSQDTASVDALENELRQLERQIKTADQEQHQLLQWALKGFPENQVEAENRWLNKAKATLKARRVELESQIKAGKEAVVSIPDLERFIDDIRKRLPELDYEGKRLALEMLNIKILIDGDHADVTGVIAPENDVLRCSNDQSPLTDTQTPVL